MADVVRDVVIRMSVQTTGDEAFKRMSTESNKATSGAQRLNGQYKTLDDSLRRVQGAIKRAGDEYARGNAGALSTLTALVKREKDLQSAINARAEALKNAGASQFQPAPDPQPKSFRDLVGRGSIKANPLLTIATASIAVANAGSIIVSSAAEATKGIAADIRGGQSAKDEGLFTKAGTAFIDALDELALRLGIKTEGNALKQRLAESGGIQVRGTSESIARQGRIGAIDRDLTKLDQLKSMTDRLHQESIDKLEKQLNLAKQTGERLNDALKKEQDLKKSQGTQFGLASKQEQDALLKIGRTLTQKGLDSLNKAEVEFAQKFDLFDRALSKAAVAKADASPAFQELRKILGEEAALQKAQVDVKVNAEIVNKIEIELKGEQAFAEAITAKMKPLQEQMLKETMAAIKLELNKEAVKRRNGIVPGF